MAAVSGSNSDEPISRNHHHTQHQQEEDHEQHEDLKMQNRNIFLKVVNCFVNYLKCFCRKYLNCPDKFVKVFTLLEIYLPVVTEVPEVTETDAAAEPSSNTEVV